MFKIVNNTGLIIISILCLRWSGWSIQRLAFWNALNYAAPALNEELQNKFMIVSCQSDSRGFIIAWKLVWKLWREGRKTRSWIFISSVIFHSSFLACLKEKLTETFQLWFWSFWEAFVVENDPPDYLTPIHFFWLVLLRLTNTSLKNLSFWENIQFRPNWMTQDCSSNMYFSVIAI